MTKKCTKCGEVKGLGEFYKDKRGKDGLRSLCKRCHNKRCNKYFQNHKAQRQLHRNKYHKTIRGYINKLWHKIRDRCNNPRYKQYKDYGGRGIKVKFESFDDFRDYVLNELKIDPRNLTIDRIDNDGNYERGNIRFVSKAENNRNKKHVARLDQERKKKTA